MNWNQHPSSDWIDSLHTADDVKSLIAFLTQQGTFQFPTLPNGLFSAAAGEGSDFELTGYRNVWVRDNVHIAWTHLVATDDPTAAIRCVRSLDAWFKTQRQRFIDIIEGRADANDPMNRPHIRFDGNTLSELPEKWSHAQNDALGYYLWLTFQMPHPAFRTSEEFPWETVALLVRYWQAIQVWQDEDSGHWEESRKVSASSLGCVIAGLTRLRFALDSVEPPPALRDGPYPVTFNEVRDLIVRCRTSMERILPSECVQDDATKRRRYDAALLFLIEPLDVLRDRAIEDQILSDIEQHLQGPHGIRRYIGDSYWCADYRELLSADQRTSDFSDSLDSRDRLLKPGLEAQWCIFDPIISCIHGRRYLKSRDPADLQRQRTALGRALSQLTQPGGRFPAYRCPESYFCERGQWVPNDITPLLWTQANLLRALESLAGSLLDDSDSTRDPSATDPLPMPS